MPAMTPTERACLECSRRMICGDKEDIYVFEDGNILLDGAVSAFKLEPSRDNIDALIAVVSQAIKLHLADIDFSKLRDKFIATDVGEVFANQIYDQLCGLSDEEWLVVHDRVDFYVSDNARIDTFDTVEQGKSS